MDGEYNEYAEPARYQCDAAAQQSVPILSGPGVENYPTDLVVSPGAYVMVDATWTERVATGGANLLFLKLSDGSGWVLTQDVESGTEIIRKIEGK